MLHRRKRRFFTIMEILFVIALLGVLAGLVAINVRKAVANQRFYSNVADVLNTLRLAQQLMLILNSDVKVKFFELPNNGGIQYSIDFEDQLSPEWKREIQHKHPPLQLVFDYTPADPEAPRGKGGEVLRFFSGGSVMSQGILRLSTHLDPNAPGALNGYICLPGYPHFLSSQTELPQLDNACNFAAQNAYNQQLTQFSIAEVRHNLQ